jgi:hypothetical protein
MAFFSFLTSDIIECKNNASLKNLLNGFIPQVLINFSKLFNY